MGQLVQPNQDSVFSKRAAFFNSLKNKIGHIMVKATALRVNLNLRTSSRTFCPLRCASPCTQRSRPSNLRS